ncbi:hypothetical protein BC834DRAFT_22180 [Gloeopeniophorella convolvens]|nr:hypothetical protein BC834DRAFT_22180 [Gloeopeniophorella convolvens]
MRFGRLPGLQDDAFYYDGLLRIPFFILQYPPPLPLSPLRRPRCFASGEPRLDVPRRCTFQFFFRGSPEPCGRAADSTVRIRRRLTRGQPSLADRSATFDIDDKHREGDHYLAVRWRDNRALRPTLPIPARSIRLRQGHPSLGMALPLYTARQHTGISSTCLASRLALTTSDSPPSLSLQSSRPLLDPPAERGGGDVPALLRRQ